MSTEPPPSAPDADRPKLRGLWGVMQTDAPVEPVVEPTEPPAEESPPTAESAATAEVARPAPKSLWDVMRATEVEPVIEEVESRELSVESQSELPSSGESSSLAHGVRPVGFSDSQPSTLDSHLPLTSRDLWAVVCGTISIPLATLACLPSFWMSVPAAVCGFVAVLSAVVLWMEPRTSPRQKMIAALAGGLGVLGLLAGPLVFTPIGNLWRETTSPRITERHLRQIGMALERHHQERGAFPVGGTTLRDADGRERGGHGWLTALLPYVDAADVYQRIDQSLPYDDPANRAALSTPIEAYFAAGGNRAPHASGFAVAHFAGVGGEVTSARGETLAAGIFAQNRAIQKDDVRDGLSQTLVAGELPGDYPPWGDPENWRTVGRGLNREPRGFGNAAGTGATMLFADGSVRFFSNRTDPDLLRRLNTRDGGDGAAR